MDNDLPPSLPPAAPPLTPPPIIVPPAAPPARGGNCWKIAALVFLILFVVTLFGGMRFVRRGWFHHKVLRQREDTLQEVMLENNHSRNRILVINLDGIISGESMDRSGSTLVKLIDDQLKAAEKDDVCAVILKVNSPGGEVLASDDIYNSIARFELSSHKPVVASMGALAASGGYYVSAPCDWIVANELTITGSIGVIMHGLNYRGLMDKVGLRPEIYKSGKFKDMMSPDKRENEITDEEKQMVQNLIDETFGKFKQVVRDGRRDAHRKHESGRSLAANWEEYADGRILSGKQAFDLGLVDELGNFEKAVTRAQKLAGVADANLIEYHQPFDITNLLRLFGKTESPTMKIDWGVSGPKLRAGYLYFIMPMAAR